METSFDVSLRDLLEAGAHFGHQKSRWNPRMRPYVFGLRGGVYIIDLQKTVVMLKEALTFLNELAAQGKLILFVGTKRQAQEIVEREAKRCEMFYITKRWLGGLLTNWQTVKKSIDRLRELDNVESDERFAHLTKKERLRLTKQRARLSAVLGGIKEIGRRPDALFVVDARREAIAVAEANKLGIPVVAIVDTDSDPTVIDYPIPANDDAMRSIDLLVTRVADAILDGRARWRAARPERAARTGRRRAPARREPPREIEVPAGAEPGKAAGAREAAAGGEGAAPAPSETPPETAPAAPPANDA
ncbi:MAG: 30S ribosomal protein S2 [Acidobacteria bacterium]|nr:MAG: 30S ribosomal protein S2 [Acidobacteriota bacterium]